VRDVDAATTVSGGIVEAVETTEIAEKIHEHHAGAHGGDDNFRKFTGIYLGFIAMLLSLATLGGSYATKEMLGSNIHASDTYAFYQAKYLRQTSYQIAADQVELQLAAGTIAPGDGKTKAEELVKRYRATAQRYESDPASGDGRKELLARARAWEAKRDHAAAQDPNFDFASALFQIAIVLGSVSIVAVSRPLRSLSAVLALIGALLALNGHFLLVHLPID
jgi:hypothetical protein